MARMTAGVNVRPRCPEPPFNGQIAYNNYSFYPPPITPTYPPPYYPITPTYPPPYYPITPSYSTPPLTYPLPQQPSPYDHPYYQQQLYSQSQSHMSQSHMHGHSSVPESSVHLKHKKKRDKGNDRDITRRNMNKSNQIYISEWSLKVVWNRNLLIIDGMRHGIKKRWHSGQISKVHPPNILESKSGSFYHIVGPPNLLLKQNMGISDKTFKLFVNGLPDNWADLILAETYDRVTADILAKFSQLPCPEAVTNAVIPPAIPPVVHPAIPPVIPPAIPPVTPPATSLDTPEIINIRPVEIKPSVKSFFIPVNRLNLKPSFNTPQSKDCSVTNSQSFFSSLKCSSRGRLLKPVLNNVTDIGFCTYSYNNKGELRGLTSSFIDLTDDTIDNVHKGVTRKKTKAKKRTIRDETTCSLSEMNISINNEERQQPVIDKVTNQGSSVAPERGKVIKNLKRNTIERQGSSPIAAPKRNNTNPRLKEFKYNDRKIMNKNSHFNITEWFLKIINDSLIVVGRRRNHYSTHVIAVHVHPPNILESKNGSVCHLVGPPNLLLKKNMGISDKTFKLFANGLPDNWADVILAETYDRVTADILAKFSQLPCPEVVTPPVILPAMPPVTPVVTSPAISPTMPSVTPPVTSPAISPTLPSVSFPVVSPVISSATVTPESIESIPTIDNETEPFVSSSDCSVANSQSFFSSLKRSSRGRLLKPVLNNVTDIGFCTYSYNNKGELRGLTSSFIDLTDDTIDNVHKGVTRKKTKAKKRTTRDDTTCSLSETNISINNEERQQPIIDKVTDQGSSVAPERGTVIKNLKRNTIERQGSSPIAAPKRNKTDPPRILFDVFDGSDSDNDESDESDDESDIEEMYQTIMNSFH